MKKAAFYFLIAISLMACSSNTPIGIAKKFLDCLVAQDYEKAKMYCTPQGARALGMIQMMGGGSVVNARYTILRDSVVGDNAWVTYETTVGDQKSISELELIKMNGDWKVDLEMRK